MMLYAGPDQIIPLTSFLGTALGFALIFWGKILNWCHKFVDSVFRRQRPSTEQAELQEPAPKA